MLWWMSLSQVSKRNRFYIEKMICDCELIINNEWNKWMSTSQAMKAIEKEEEENKEKK